MAAIPTLRSDEVQIYRLRDFDCVTLRLYDSAVPAGFPSPAADYREDDIDFNQLLRPHPSSTFVVRVSGDSMIEANIPDKAWLVVDRSIKPKSGTIVVAVVNSEFTVKRYITNSSGVRLMPANSRYNPIVITEEMDFRVWGTVTKVIIDPLVSGI